MNILDFKLKEYIYDMDNRLGWRKYSRSRRGRRIYRKYDNMDDRVTWNAYYEILHIANIVANNTDNTDLQDKIKSIIKDPFLEEDLTFELWCEFMSSTSQEDLIWFLDKIHKILYLYSKIAPKVINLNYHKFKIPIVDLSTEKYDADNILWYEDWSQDYALEWLLERFKIIQKYPTDKNIKELFRVWSYCSLAFWW